MAGQTFLKHTVHVREEAVDIAIMYLRYILVQLNDYSCLNVKDIPRDAIFTSLPQSWHIPRATSICPLPAMGTHYARSETDRNGERSRDPIRCKLYDARGPALRCGLQRQHVRSFT